MRITKNIKNLAKRSKTIVKVYFKLRSHWNFLRYVLVRNFLRIGRIKLFLIVKPYTLLPYSRLSKLYELASRLEKQKVEGSFVECGVWNGGSAGLIASVAEYNKSRHVWLFDSWEGLPESNRYDVRSNGELGKQGMFVGSEENVKELLFKKIKLNSQRFHLVKGWFTDTLFIHKKDIGQIALLHLDCDLYESVKLCLEELYSNVVEDGVVVIDDYGSWKGCKKAVDDFILKRNIKAKLIKIDDEGIYFLRKEARR